MFKLVKILHSGVNVAEGRYMPAREDEGYPIGSVAMLKDGTLTACGSTDAPDYVIGEEISGGRAIAFAYPISPDMIFETAISGDPTAVNKGDTVTLSIENGAALGVSTSTSGGVAEIYDKTGANKSGDSVFVRFRQ